MDDDLSDAESTHTDYNTKSDVEVEEYELTMILVKEVNICIYIWKNKL